jgi:hypothetical protein
MTEPAEKFATAVEGLFNQQLDEFAAWAEANWQAEADADFNEQQADGWNRCCASLRVAFEAWSVASQSQRPY